MVSQAPASRLAAYECTTAAVQQSPVARMRAALAAAIAVAFALTLRSTVTAATISVNSLADTGAAGICVLRDAITAANTMTATNGCAAGSGNDTINFSVAGTIALASTLPQITASPLTINGPASPGITIDGGGTVQVMLVAAGAILNLADLSIAHGFVTNANGGGIFNDGTLTVSNSTFSGNRATCSSCGVDGGGIYNNGGTLTVAHSTFFSNTSNNCGGGISNFGALTVTNSTFSRNTSEFGGGICTSAVGPASISNSVFSGNSTSGADGAGIYNDGGMLTVTNSTFFSNKAQRWGGGILSIATLLVTNSTFSGNSAAAPVGGFPRNGGGGIANFGGNLSIINSTFSRNGALGYGGGISNAGPPIVVTNSTFSGNSAGGSGASAYNENSYGGSISFKSTILAADAVNCGGTITDAGYNISDDSSCGFTKTGSANNGDNVNPLLSSTGLRNNGGPTQTIALQSTSPAIDAIPVADCTDQASPSNPIITDQRGFPRPDAGETACDIGAFEVQDSSFIPFSHFSGSLKIDPDAGVFYLSGGFTLGPGGSIDPPTQSVTFTVGNYSTTLPPGSFVKYKTGYVYQQKVNGIFLCIFIKFTNTPGTYQLLANRFGGTLSTTTSPVPVTLTIGDDSGTAQMNARFD